MITRYFRPEKQAEYYNNVFKDNKEYSQHYKDSFYFPLWQEVVKQLPEGSEVIDLGCGTGQLTRMMHDKGHNVIGLDFSKTAIKTAKKNNPMLKDWFRVADIKTKINYSDGYIVCCEVLEHIRYDLDMLRNWRAKGFILTVPYNDDPAHQRFFRGADSVIDYYSQVFSEMQVTTFVYEKEVIYYLINAIK